MLSWYSISVSHTLDHLTANINVFNHYAIQLDYLDT